MSDRVKRSLLGLAIVGALMAGCGTPTPSATSLITSGTPTPSATPLVTRGTLTPTPLPSSTAPGLGWASLNCGRLDDATCLRIVTMVENTAPALFGPATSVVADDSCGPGDLCEAGFHALVVLIPAGKISQADLAIFWVSEWPDQPATIGTYPSLPEFMQWVQKSGLVGTVVVSGGPAPGNLAGPGPIDLSITAAGKVVVSQPVQSGTTFRVTLPPGMYEISGLDGNAPCISTTVDVAAGEFTSVTVTCSIR